MKRLAGLVLTIGLLSSVLFSATPAYACSGPSGGSMPTGGPRPTPKEILKEGATTRSMETSAFRTLHIDAEVAKKTYRIGDVAKFPVHVTRPAKEDPMRLGLPWDRPYVEDAANVNVGVGLLAGDVFLAGFAKTDDAGKAVIKIKIKSYAQPSQVDTAFYAWNVVLDTPCLRIEENGFHAEQAMFEIRR